MLERQKNERSDSLYDIAYLKGFCLGYRRARIQSKIKLYKELNLSKKDCKNPKNVEDYEDLSNFIELYKYLPTEKIAEHIIKESEFMHS